MEIFKLGKQAAKYDDRTLMFADYARIPQLLPEVPVKYEWSKKMSSIGMMLNDNIGDCAIATAGHLTQLWTANNNNQIIISDSDILKAYSDISGYDPKTGENDNGCVVLDVLNYFRKTGIGGHKIGAYVSVNIHNLANVKAACYLFGGVYLGVALPVSAQGKDRWSMPVRGENGIRGGWGGHAIPISDIYASYGNVITWGQLLQMDWDFFSAYCDEAYAIISPDFIVNDKSPVGFDMAQLQSDLRIVTS